MLICCNLNFVRHPHPPPTYNFYTFYDVRTYIYINLALRRVTVLTYAFMH